MADTTALKNRIRAAIKANDNQEITGPVLQQTLLDIVDENDLNPELENEVQQRQNGDNTLQEAINTEKTRAEGVETQLNNLITGIKNNIDNGYVYAGIATPSTEPVSGKVFYIAIAAGTYTNFGGQVLTQGVNILSYNDSVWSNKQLIGIDDEPTAESDNLVKSGGCVGRKDVTERFTLDNALQGYIIDTAGNLVTNQYTGSYCVTDYIKCHYGDTVEFRSGLGSNNGSIFSIYNSSKELIGNYKMDYPASGGKTTIELKDCAYIRYSVLPNSNVPYSEQYLRIYPNLQILNPKINKLNKSVYEDDYFTLDGATKGYVLDANGDPLQNQYTTNYYITDYIQCHYGDIVKYRNGIGSGSIFTVYNKNKEKINNYVDSYPTNGGERTIEDVEAAYLRYGVVPNSVTPFTEQYLRIYPNLNIVNRGKVFHVGARQAFTKFIDGLKEAIKYSDSILYVDAGEYDLFDEYGTEQAVLDTDIYEKNILGPIVENNVHIICNNNTLLKAEYNGTNYKILGDFSILNVRGSFTIENATLVGQGIRYCVHDDAPIYGIGNVRSKYINCHMEHKGNLPAQEETGMAWEAPCCLGCGDNENSILEVIGGEYKTTADYAKPISIHNHTGSGNGEFIVTDIYIPSGQKIVLYTLGAESYHSTVFARITNSSIGAGIEYIDGESGGSTVRKFDVIEFNNVIDNNV